MATARMAAGSLMETVSNTANMLSSTVNVVADSVNMLGSFVGKHRIMQEKRNLIDLDNFDNRLIEETTMENSKRKAAIEDYLQKNPERANFFNEEYARLTQLLNPKPQQAQSQD